MVRMTETDLTTSLKTLSISERPGRYCFVDISDVKPGVVPAATIREEEGVNAIVLVEEVLRGEPEFVATWLTLDVDSDLAAVGLTAAIATCLASEAIPCNVLAGKVHDHILVPHRDAPLAIAALQDLAAAQSLIERDEKTQV